MCGIGGIVGAATPGPEALERMATMMRHRGPDGEGFWRGAGVGFAFRRLAILDLHERSNQPMHLDGLHLVFNGELYNYIELREELRALGRTFHTEGDAEVLLNAWAQWGEAALDRFNGMFAFGIWDEDQGQLTLATDPFAEKPLFYHATDDRLTFASDIAALRAAAPGVGTPNEIAVAQFLALASLPTLPDTFFADIQRVPPAHLLRFRSGRLESRRYWSPRQIEVPTVPDVAAARLRDLLLDSVRLRLRSDVPVGTSLSGGIDSSTIVELSARISGDHCRHAFTAMFPGSPLDEWKYAREVAVDAGVERHHSIAPCADELFQDLEAVVCDQEEPFRSTSIYAQWRVMRAARDAGVVVLLDGQGADELLGGYFGAGAGMLSASGMPGVTRILKTDWRLAALLALQMSGLQVPRALARRNRIRHASPYVTEDLARVASVVERAPPTWDASGSWLRRELLAETFGTSLPVLCRYADRSSMSHSVEVRLPFLDRRVAEFALSLPRELVFRGGMTKGVLRDAMRGLVSDTVLDRTDKIGYETPEQMWLETPAVRSRIAEILLDPAARESGRYDVAAVEHDLEANRWRDPNAIWRAVNVEVWQRAFVTRPFRGVPTRALTVGQTTQ